MPRPGTGSAGCRGRRRSAGGSRPGRTPATAGGSSLSCSASRSRSAALAYALAARRDFAAGLLPDRPGPAAAAAGLRSPLALAWRLQRGSFFAWAAVFVVIGFVVGGLASNVGDFLKSPQARTSSPSSAAWRASETPFSPWSWASPGCSPRCSGCRRRCVCAPRSPRCAPNRCSPPRWDAPRGRGATWRSPSPGPRCCSSSSA